MSKDTTYKVTVTGKLNIHGVEKDRTIDGVIKVEKGIPTVTSTFKVACADHNVEIPKIVTEKIAEVLDIKVSAVYSPYQSKK